MSSTQGAAWDSFDLVRQNVPLSTAAAGGLERRGTDLQRTSSLASLASFVQAGIGVEADRL
jgi:hypothetical protein